MKNLIIENAPEKVAHQIQAEVGPMYAQASGLCAQAYDIQVSDEKDTQGMNAAKASRLTLRKLRTTAVKKCAELKSDSLAYGRAIDAARRQVEDLFKPAEDHLLMQETYAQRIEVERAMKCRAEREAVLVGAGGDPGIYAQLEKMPDSEFAALIEQVKERVAKIKADAEERERIEKEAAQRDQLERLRLAEENAMLKAEAAERERIAEKQRAQQQAIIDEERSRREELEAKQRAEQARADAEAKAKADAEKDAANAPLKQRLAALKMSPLQDKFTSFPLEIGCKIQRLITGWNNEIQIIINDME
jgi:hypothetical protein